jgi:hypothetical protein
MIVDGGQHHYKLPTMFMLLADTLAGYSDPLYPFPD